MFHDNEKKPNIKRSIDILGGLWSFLSPILDKFIARLRLDDFERTNQIIVYAHDRPPVVEHSTIVGRGEHCYQLPFAKKLIPFLNNLGPQICTWCDRQIRSSSLSFRNPPSTSFPNRCPIPLS